MTERSVSHGSFTIDRIFPARPERVFRAWSDREQKAKWFPVGEIFEFKVGGREYQPIAAPMAPSSCSMCAITTSSPTSASFMPMRC